MSLSAQERFYSALSGEKPDRVPAFPKIWVNLAASIENLDLRDLIEDPVWAMHAVVDSAERVHADGARLFCFPRRHTQIEDETVFEVDRAGNRLGPIDMKGGLATQISDPSLVRLEDPSKVAFVQFWSSPEPFVKCIDDVKRMAVPDKSFYEARASGTRQREMIAAWTGDDLALIGDCGSATLAFSVLLRHMDNAMIDLVEEKILTHAIMEKGAAIVIEKAKFHIDTGLTILRLNDSVANMNVISPNHWREFIHPYMKTVCTEIHRYCPKARIYCHICGNVMPVLELIMDTGVDCIGPLDPLGGVTCSEARAAVGDRVALMGGVDTLSFVNKEPEALIEETRRCIEGAGRDGGYVVGSGCALPCDTRIENLYALHEAAVQFGAYR